MSTNPANDQLFNEARDWFNSMPLDSRNQMILVMYKLCLSTKDVSHNKLIESLNAQWNDKYKKLSMENEILSKNQEMGAGMIINKINQMEATLNNSVVSLSSKITPSANGKIGEDYIDQLLSKIPNTSLTNITQSKGSGDFIFTTGDIRIMIESKNWTNSSIKGNPKEIENFRQVAIEAKEESNIDFAIMALHRVTDLKGRAMEIEMEMTKKGALMLLYVTNLFNHPERILYAIDAGILLLKQQSQHTINKDKFVYQIYCFLKGINSIEVSIKERQKIIKDLTLQTKKDLDQIQDLKQMLDNVLNDTDHVSTSDKLVNFYIELMKIHGDKITKSMLETKCLENKVPARVVREAGGIKAIKQMVLDKKELLSKESEESEESESQEESEESE